MAVTVATCLTQIQGSGSSDPDTLRKPDSNIKTEWEESASSSALFSEANKPPIIPPVVETSPSEKPSQVLPVPYTVFTRFQKRILLIVLMLTMLASPLTATIYFPLLPSLAQHFHVSIQSINLTITIYIIFQAISPLVLATMSDSLGRRPVYLFIYALYTLANLGLALNQRNYPGLLILRAVQSFGASAVLAVAFGVVADVWPPARRGSVLGPTQGAANLAVCIGPVLGGWIALASGGFRWVFWALTIFGGVVWLVVGMAMPETARNLVGNGSANRENSKRWWERPWWDIIMKKKKKKKKEEEGRMKGQEAIANEESSDVVIQLGASPPHQQPTFEPRPSNQNHSQDQNQEPPKTSTSLAKPKTLKMLNPLPAIRIIFYKDTALVLWLAASPYAVWYCIQTSIPPIYKNIYHFSELQVGLAYLAGGAGTVLGGYANGKLMDWNYRITARKMGHVIDHVSGDDVNNFPIERARARGGWYLLIIYTCALAGYGWSVTPRSSTSSGSTSAAIPLTIQFLLSVLCTYFQQTFNALLVDIYPSSPGTAAAASNITRCALSAVAIAILQPLTDRIGRGWFFTAAAIISGGGGGAAMWAMMRWSLEWRRERLVSCSR